MKTSTFILLFLLISGVAFAQNFKAVSNGVYNETTPGLFQVGLRLESGSIKQGDKIDVLTPEGTRYSFTVTRMRNPYEDIKKADAETGTFYVYLLGPKDAVFTKNASFLPGGSKAPAADAGKNKSSFDFTSTLDNKPWNAISTGNGTYYKKGLGKMYGGKPFLMLPFRATAPPDQRHLDIVLIQDEIKPGKYTLTSMEILLSGSPVGDKNKEELFGYKYPQTNAGAVVLEITSYKETGNGTAVISGKISGPLKKVFGIGSRKLENGVFTDVKIYVEKERH
mgnify:FL=1